MEDEKLADVVLSTSYTPAWDYPFRLIDRKTSAVLLAGKGEGPFSGIIGVNSVAKEFIKLTKGYRTPAAAPTKPRPK